MTSCIVVGFRHKFFYRLPIGTNPIHVQQNIDLSPYNTFGIQASAKAFTTVHSVSEVQALIQSPAFIQQKVLLLGGGSNLLLTQDFDGLVVKIEIMGKEIVRETDDQVVLKVGAGENWHALVLYCVERGWGGVENLSLIPGTAGAAPMQNIGAYGTEMKDVIVEVEAVEIRTANVHTFSNEACAFGYRDSIFKQQAKGLYIITAITLALTKRDHALNISYGAVRETITALGYAEPSVKAISDAVIHIRRSKLPDPAVIGNAGSFFKNPTIPAAHYAALQQHYPSAPGYPAEEGMVKVPAGWLIEQCGWKGKRTGNIGVHQHQALVLVNYGGGKGNDLWQLALQIQHSVKEKFNIDIHPEVNVV
ncbi:UDP-N-acetylmuramate dehydrogenase [Fulvivirgaceae bacterium QH1ED-6-2]|nr:UDP-N-acetylmuramate dehydrogenase [Parachryseolinea silvisoli]